jgi:hypothetical protein
MSNKAKLTALRRLAQQPFTDDNFRIIMDSLKSESDRAAIVIAGSLLEDELASRIRRSMRALSKDESASLFGFDGPVGTFSSRILTAYAFGLIDSRDRELLNIVRELRNACAHARVPLSFETPELREAARLMLPEDLRAEIDGTKLRACFLAVVSLLFVILTSGKSDFTHGRVSAVIDRVYSKAPDGHAPG